MKQNYINVILMPFIFIFIVGFSFGNKNNEKANEILSQAESFFDNDKKKAVLMAEDILIRYPDTDTAKKVRINILPKWLHVICMNDISNYYEKFAGQMPDEVIKNNHLKSLIRILQDFPDYELREALEAQIMVFIFLRESLPVFLKLSQDSRELKGKVERAISNASSKEDMIKLRLKISAEITNEFLANASAAFQKAQTSLRGLFKKHQLSKIFTEFANLFQETSDYLLELKDFQDFSARDDVYECIQATFGLGSKKLKDSGKCDLIWNTFNNKKFQMEVKSIKLEGKYSDLIRKSNLEMESFADKLKLQGFIQLFENMRKQ